MFHFGRVSLLSLLPLIAVLGASAQNGIAGPTAPKVETFTPIQPGGQPTTPTRSAKVSATAPQFSGVRSTSNAVAPNIRSNSADIDVPRPGQQMTDAKNVDHGSTRLVARNTRPYQGRFPFADLNGAKGSSEELSYIEAYRTIASMTEGHVPLDMRKAVYAVEQPWMGDRVSEAELSVMIGYLVRAIDNTVRTEGLDPTDPLVKHYGIQKLFQDTLQALAGDRPLPPFQYDFNDFMGHEDRANLMVTKLLLTGKGQCRSMPLLYLLLAEAMGVEAFLAFSPGHSYIMFQGRDGTFHNFEATNGHLTSDAWVKGSGFVRSEAIRSGIYMDTLGTRGVLAQLLVDLAGEYGQRFGYDEGYMGRCLRLALKLDPRNINAKLLLSDLHTASFDRGAWEDGLFAGGDINDHPTLALRLRELYVFYDHIDDLGHAEMPAGAYIAWLGSLEEERQKRETEELRHQILLAPLNR